MTSDEALEVLGYLLGHEKAVDSGELGDVQNHLNSQEQEALKVILSDFRELKEKATAKEVKSRQCWKCEREECVPGCELSFDRCPNCNEVLDNDCGEQYKFCPDCGQQLLWT